MSRNLTGAAEGVPPLPSNYLKTDRHIIWKLCSYVIALPVHTLWSNTPIMNSKKIIFISITGALSETPLHGGLVGPTFACIIGIQFRNLRKCDRFWYEGGNPLIRFTEAQLDEIRKISLAKITCDNCDRVTHIQRAMFDVPDPFLNPRVPCSALPAINLDLWKERVSCNVGGTGIEIGDANRISPCTMCTCTKEGPVCQSLKIENCFHLAQAFSPEAILKDHVCKVQCAFAFRAFPKVAEEERHLGFSK